MNRNVEKVEEMKRKFKRRNLIFHPFVDFFDVAVIIL
jgi:hypothetical protein